MFRRETIIALRARHQAYRIATEVLHPHVETTAPPQPAMPGMIENLSPRIVHREPLGKRLIDAAFVPLVVIAVLLAWFTLLVLLKDFSR